MLNVYEMLKTAAANYALYRQTRDEIAPLKDQYKLYAQLNTPTELAVIPHVGHLVHYEKPADAAGFIHAFIGA